MDPFAAEASLSFATPSIYPSKSYATRTAEFYPSAGKKDYYQPGDSVSINLGNLGQAAFFDPRACQLAFTASILCQPDATVPLNIDTTQTAALWDGAGPGFHWGAPQVQASVSVQGSLGDVGFTKDKAAFKQLYNSRLLSAASGTSSATIPAAWRATSGAVWAAGARDCLERTSGVNGEIHVAKNGAPAADLSIRSRGSDYLIPLGQYTPLFGGAVSSLVPVAYLSTGSDGIVFQFRVQDIADQVYESVGVLPGSVNVIITDLRICASYVEVLSGPVLSEIQSLFRALTTVPLPLPSGGVSELTIPMIVKSIKYVYAQSKIPAGSQTFSLSVQANHPSVKALAMRFVYDRTPAQYSQLGLLADVNKDPALFFDDLRLALSVNSYPNGGVTDVSYLLNPGGGGPETKVQNSRAMVYKMFRDARHCFSPWDDGDRGDLDDMMGCWVGTGSDCTTALPQQWSYSAPPPDGTGAKAPGLVCIPFETFSQSARVPGSRGHGTSAYCFTGMDARGISQINVSGRVQVGADDASGAVGPTATPITVHAWLAVDTAWRLFAGKSVADVEYQIASGN